MFLSLQIQMQRAEYQKQRQGQNTSAAAPVAPLSHEFGEDELDAALQEVFWGSALACIQEAQTHSPPLG